MLVRIQGPAGTHDVELGRHATVKDLRCSIEDLLGIPPAEQQIKAGFPPQAVSAAEEEELSCVLGTGSAHILVSRTGPIAVAAGSSRRKPQTVRRVVPGSAPAGGAGPSQPSNLSAGSSAGDEARVSSSAPAVAPAPKRKRGSKAGTPAAHLLRARREDGRLIGRVRHCRASREGLVGEHGTYNTRCCCCVPTAVQSWSWSS